MNLFSYTGALSVTCARAGAKAVTSVDTSAGVQAWAAGNFARSGLSDPKRWRFETGDAVRFLARAARDKERYDVVLIDPPTFSTARGSPWALDRDYPELIAKAAAVIPPDGLLWLAANTHELGSLAKLAHKGLRTANRTGAILEQGGLPAEYPTSQRSPTICCVCRSPPSAGSIGAGLFSAGVRFTSVPPALLAILGNTLAACVAATR